MNGKDFKIEKRDEGFAVVRVSDERLVAHVETTAVGFRDDPKLKFPERTETPLARERCWVHFTAAKLSIEELLAVAELIAGECPAV